MKKKYLITEYKNLNYPIGSNLIFTDEYLYNLYTRKQKSIYKCSYLHSIENINKIGISNNKLIKKKLKSYRKVFAIFLNNYHKTQYSSKYWGLIIDQFLITLLEVIIIEIRLLKKINTRNLNTFNETIEKKYILDSMDFYHYRHSDNFLKFLKASILKELKFKFVNLKFKNKKIDFKKYKKDLFSFTLTPLIKIYIYFFKPLIISNGSIGLKNSFYFFLKSCGKILNVPSRFLFNSNFKNFKINHTLRLKIKVPQKDLIDKIFNSMIKNILPTSYVENFKTIQKNINFLSKNVNTIGTSTLHYENDYFTILAAEILKKKVSF